MCVGVPMAVPVLREVRRFEPGDAEVHHLHLRPGQDDEVRRLDVAVDHALLVRIVERGEQLLHDLEDLDQLEAPAARDELLQLVALGVLHDDEGHGVVAAILVDPDDIGVLQAPARLRLALEAGDGIFHLGGLEVVAEDDLDGDLALDDRVEALVHHPHRALAERTGDGVLADLLRVFWHSFSFAVCRLSLDQLHGLLQAAAHAVERRAQDADLVPAGLELGHVEVARGDLVRGRGHARDGRMIMSESITFSTMKVTTKIAASEDMNTLKASLALWMGSDIGTETTCAPMISMCFQPKPLLSP
jgi:hypothetical protein